MEHEKRLHEEEKSADELVSGYAPAVRQSGRTVKNNCRKDMLRALYITGDNMGHKHSGKNCFAHRPWITPDDSKQVQNLAVPTCGPSIENLVSAQVHVNRNPPEFFRGLESWMYCELNYAVSLESLANVEFCGFHVRALYFNNHRTVPGQTRSFLFHKRWSTFQKNPCFLRSTNITKPYPYKLLNGNAYRRRWLPEKTIFGDKQGFYMDGQGARESQMILTMYLRERTILLPNSNIMARLGFSFLRCNMISKTIWP